jgi:hypothetical protein
MNEWILFFRMVTEAQNKPAPVPERPAEVATVAPAKAAFKDHRTPEQKASDDKLIADYMKLTPTGKLIPIKFEDGTVLYVPEVK